MGKFWGKAIVWPCQVLTQLHVITELNSECSLSQQPSCHSLEKFGDNDVASLQWANLIGANISILIQVSPDQDDLQHQYALKFQGLQD